MFKEYPKIHRLGKEETDGILNGRCVIQEKIDGANTSIWLQDNEIRMGSRRRELESGFNGFVDYVKSNKEIYKFLQENPTLRLYGEWLVRHTISYNEEAYKKFYLFDVQDGDDWRTQSEVQEVANIIGIPTPQIFAEIDKPTESDLLEFVGKTNLGTRGEGVVIKNLSFINKFGYHCYAKIVQDSFKEDNAIIFGGNNKHSDSYWEIYIMNKYITLARVQKAMNKMQPTIDKRLDYEHTPMISGVVYHDMITEEAWEIAKKVGSIDFRKLKNLCMKKIVQIYKDILSNSLSVAYYEQDK